MASPPMADGPESNPPEGDGTGASSASAATQPDLAAEVASWKDKAMRARADYDNLSRRVARDAAAERERAKARVLEAFIPLNELAQMAGHQADTHPEHLADGVKMLAREFSRMLEREGLTPIGTVGEPFNALHHEAVAQEAHDGVAPGAVSRVIQVGYRLGDKVLRYAKVAVAPQGPPSGPT